MIRFDHVSKTFANGTEAVKDLCLDVEDGEILVLLGTSGSGKTTSMKMVNRLIEPTSGAIWIDDRNVAEADPVELRRTIGYAVQHIGLFPHITVADNIGMVPALLGWDRPDIEARVGKLLEMVGLEAETYRGRYPRQLSGGQRQRIGVARALGADPPVILMDEPFGALDPITREQLQNEFLDLQTELHKTIIFVTHDVYEAVKIGDRIAILDTGQLQQVAEPREIVESPANEFVDQFLGQHRFQLSLVTRQVRHIAEKRDDLAQRFESGQAEDMPTLKPQQALIDALDTFKQSKCSELLVVDRGKYVGAIEKGHLFEEISRTLGEVEGDEYEND